MPSERCARLGFRGLERSPPAAARCVPTLLCSISAACGDVRACAAQSLGITRARSNCAAPACFEAEAARTRADAREGSISTSKSPCFTRSPTRTSTRRTSPDAPAAKRARCSALTSPRNDHCASMLPSRTSPTQTRAGGGPFGPLWPALRLRRPGPSVIAQQQPRSQAENARNHRKNRAPTLVLTSQSA